MIRSGYTPLTTPDTSVSVPVVPPQSSSVKLHAEALIAAQQKRIQQENPDPDIQAWRLVLGSHRVPRCRDYWPVIVFLAIGFVRRAFAGVAFSTALAAFPS